MSKPPPSPYLTIPEVADYLRVSRRTVFTLLRTGALQRTKLVGGRTVIHRASLDAFVARAAGPRTGAHA
jgi:excisionase family DNA binding protein